MRTRLSFLFILSMLFIVPGVSRAQSLTPDPETNKFQYQETVSIDSLSKDDLYERAKEWMTNYFKTNKFDVNDKANYTLGHEGNFQVSYTYDFKYKSENTVLFTLTLNEKDGKYRYTISDFKIYDNKTGPKTAQPLEVYYPKMKTNTKKEFTANFTQEVNKLIENLKAGMAAAKQEDKEDW